MNEDWKPKIQVQYRGEKKLFFPEEISSMVLTKMKETAEAYLGKVRPNSQTLRLRTVDRLDSNHWSHGWYTRLSIQLCPWKQAYWSRDVTTSGVIVPRDNVDQSRDGGLIAAEMKLFLGRLFGMTVDKMGRLSVRMLTIVFSISFLITWPTK